MTMEADYISYRPDYGQLLPTEVNMLISIKSIM